MFRVSKLAPVRDQILTTGDAAALCRVAARTVSKWFDAGIIPGCYRLPNAANKSKLGDRRIPAVGLIQFMLANEMRHLIPAKWLYRVMFVDVPEQYRHGIRAVLEALTGEPESISSVVASGTMSVAMAVKEQPVIILATLGVGRDVLAVLREATKQLPPHPDCYVVGLVTEDDGVVPTDVPYAYSGVDAGLWMKRYDDHPTAAAIQDLSFVVEQSVKRQTGAA